MFLPRLWIEKMMTLDDKIAKARELLCTIATGYAPEHVAVAWTGGKDSTVALHLWRDVLAECHPGARASALNLDTGHKFPEVLAFRDALAVQWDISLDIVRPHVAADYPVAVDRVTCCRDLKVLPLQNALLSRGVKVLITGVRADEHPDRAGRGEREQVAMPPHERVHPVMHFGEMDIWAYITAKGLSYCSLYGQGYRSLGCVPCTALPVVGGGERSGRDATKEASMDTLHALGYF